MPVSLSSVFVAAFFIGLFWYFLLSVALMFLIRLMEFAQPKISRMSVPYLIRYAIASVLAAATATYWYAREPAQTGEAAWLAIVLSLLVWSVLLVVLDLFAVRAED